MKKTLSCTIHNIRKPQDDKQLSSPFTPRRYYEGIARKSVYLKNRDLEGCLSKAALTYLDALTRTLPKDMHYRKIGQKALAKKAGRHINTIKAGQKELQEAGIIVVKHQYRPNPRNSKRPTRKASLVWLIGLTKDELRYLDGSDFDDIEPRLLLLHVKPAVRLQIMLKIPDQNAVYHDFHKYKNGDFIGTNFVPYISEDIDAEVVPSFIPCNKTKDPCQETDSSSPKDSSETSEILGSDNATPQPQIESSQDEDTVGCFTDYCHLIYSSGETVPRRWNDLPRGKGWGGVSWS